MSTDFPPGRRGDDLPSVERLLSLSDNVIAFALTASPAGDGATPVPGRRSHLGRRPGRPARQAGPPSGELRDRVLHHRPVLADPTAGSSATRSATGTAWRGGTSRSWPPSRSCRYQQPARRIPQQSEQPGQVLIQCCWPQSPHLKPAAQMRHQVDLMRRRAPAITLAEQMPRNPSAYGASGPLTWPRPELLTSLSSHRRRKEAPPSSRIMPRYSPRSPPAPGQLIRHRHNPGLGIPAPMPTSYPGFSRSTMLFRQVRAVADACVMGRLWRLPAQ